MPNKTTSSQELYTLVDQQLKVIEDIFLKVEKKYFLLSPMYDTLDVRLDHLIKILQVNKVYHLARKVKTFKRDLSILSRHRGYSPETFQNLFTVLNKVRQLSVDDIVTTNSLNKKIQIFNNKILGFLLSTDQSKSRQDYIDSEMAYKKLLMVSDNGTNFLIPIKKKLWKKKIIRHAYQDYLKIKIKLEKGNELYRFNSLMKGNREKRSSIRFAVLILDENGKKKTFLTDKIHGTVYLHHNLFLQKIQYLNVGSETEVFIELKRERYFIKKLS